MATASIDVRIVTITEDDLRRLIREEVSRALLPNTIGVPYIGDVIPRSPEVWSGTTSIPAATGGTVMNVEDYKQYLPVEDPMVDPTVALATSGASTNWK